MAPEFFQKYNREFALSAKYGETDHNDIGPSIEATRTLFSRLGDDLRVPSNEKTLYLFARSIGAMIDRAAEDDPSLLEDDEFRRMLKEIAVRFFLRPETG